MAYRALVLLLLFTGCSSREGGSASPDSGGTGADTGTRDAGGGTDAGSGDDAGSPVDGGATADSGSDAGSDDDAGTPGDAGGDWDGCVPPPCPAPPEGCHYEGATMCTCGTLVCGSTCGGFLGLTCAAGEYCDYPASMPCGIADGTGTCMERPFACAGVYMPVCGCDGMTYGNACEAHAAGTDVYSDGAC